MKQQNTKTVCKESSLRSIASSLHKNFVLKPALKLFRPRSTPAFWTMPYDTICREILLNGFYEKDLLKGMCALVKDKQTTVLDVGANIGNHSIYFSQNFKNVVAFEPVQRNCWIFKANLHLNRISNVDLIEVALSNSNGELVCAHYDANDTNMVLHKSNEAPLLGSDIVQASVGDEQLAQREESTPISLIKIDVEGHEPEVIQGLRSTIMEHKPLIVWEAFTRDSVSESRVLLEAMGYKYFYHLTTRRYGIKWFDKLVNAFERAVYVVPLDLCETYDGMNIASPDKIS